MRATLSHIGANMFCGPLEGWDDPQLEVYSASLGNGEMYVAFWRVEEWTEHDRTGRTHCLFASGTLRQHDDMWSGDIVHIGTRGKVMGWRATAQKGSRTLEFETL